MRCFAVGCLCRVIGALPPGHERRRGAPGCLLARACAAATLLNEQDNVFHWLVGTAPPPPPPPPSRSPHPDCGCACADHRQPDVAVLLRGAGAAVPHLPRPGAHPGRGLGAVSGPLVVCCCLLSEVAAGGGGGARDEGQHLPTHPPGGGPPAGFAKLRTALTTSICLRPAGHSQLTTTRLSSWAAAPAPDPACLPAFAPSRHPRPAQLSPVAAPATATPPTRSCRLP